MRTDNTQRLPYVFARKHGVVIDYRDTDVYAFYSKPHLPPAIMMELRRFSGKKIEFKMIEAAEFETMLGLLYQHESGSAQKFADDAKDALSLENAASTIALSDDLLAQEDEAPVIRLINAMLMEAIRENASDIHVENFENLLLVRFRIDGVLVEMLRLPPALAPMLVSRLKIMAKLDIAEKRMPQDGRISLIMGSQELDARVSTIPVGAGERVVLRLLDKRAVKLELANLGFSPANIDLIKNLITRPHGVILVTGPTGSGKTTSLYAMLGELNDRTKNIMTVEDPIEYQIEGVGQTQVNTKIEMTFARALRAILRQDPDVVMIGEIRDAETAKIAVQASITGHLVLSTLHTNSAVGAVTRLIDMGIEPFLLSSSLTALLAQRLVRRLCDACKIPYYPTESEQVFLDIESMVPVYQAAGCPKCRGLGYKGRLAIYEILPIDDTMRAIIHKNAGEEELNAYIHQYYPPITQDARAKVREGLTSLQEIIRVTSE